MAVGAAAAAAWAMWLRAYLFEYGPSPEGVLAAPVTLCWSGPRHPGRVPDRCAGGRLFPMLLAGGFTYLSLQAVRNVGLFALVAGTVLAWNMGDWTAAMAAGLPPSRVRRVAAWGARAVVAGLLVAWSVGVVTGRYASLVGDTIRFGLRERPSTFAHEAARFAGQAGLPGRASVFHLGQAGVYLYHNGPGRKVCMDGRLEVPSLSTFQTYVRIQDRLNRNDDRWDDAVRRLGDPLILISHEGWSEAEATLLAHPRWRCVYFDEVASVFVPRQGPSSAPGYPDFDFAALHFERTARAATTDAAGRAAIEAEAILGLSRGAPETGRRPLAGAHPDADPGVRPGTRVAFGRVGRSDILATTGPHRVGNGTRPETAAAGPRGLLGPGDRAPVGSGHVLLPSGPRGVAGRRRDPEGLAACFAARRMSEARRGVEFLLTQRASAGDVFRLLDARIAGRPRARGRTPTGPPPSTCTSAILTRPAASGPRRPIPRRRPWAGRRMAGADLAALDADAAEAPVVRP